MVPLLLYLSVTLGMWLLLGELREVYILIRGGALKLPCLECI